MLSRTKNSTQKYAGARPSIRKYCRARRRYSSLPTSQSLQGCRRPPHHRRRHCNVALEGREEQTVATTRLRPRPFPSRAPSSRFERCRRQSQDSAGEREEGHRPNDGQRGRVRSRARLPPPPRDATVRFRGSGGSSDDDDDKKQRQWRQQRQRGGVVSTAVAAASARLRQR